ncbi:MAG: hypothetical protein K8R79_06660 [Calditrichales bacterium]|nr:hypothetical protein [Calditrichales bacterium]
MKKRYLLYGIYLFCLFFILSCCHKEIVIISAECWKSPELALKVSNQTGQDITLLSNNEEKVPHQTVVPDDTYAVFFNAFIYHVVDPDQPETTDNPIIRRTLKATDETPFLFTTGNSYQLRVLLSDEDIHRFIIEPDSGWFKDPVENNRLNVIIDGPPSPLAPSN